MRRPSSWPSQTSVSDDRTIEVEAGLRDRVSVLVGDDDHQPAGATLGQPVLDGDLRRSVSADVDALPVGGLIALGSRHFFEPVPSGRHGVEDDLAVVGAVVGVAALVAPLLSLRRESPAGAGDGVAILIAHGEHDLSRAGGDLGCLDWLHLGCFSRARLRLWRFGGLDLRHLGRRGGSARRLMRNEELGAGWLDVDRQIGDGSEAWRRRRLAQGQRGGRDGVEDDGAVTVIVAGLEPKLDDGEAGAGQRRCRRRRPG